LPPNPVKNLDPCPDSWSKLSWVPVPFRVWTGMEGPSELDLYQIRFMIPCQVPRFQSRVNFGFVQFWSLGIRVWVHLGVESRWGSGVGLASGMPKKLGSESQSSNPSRTSSIRGPRFRVDLGLGPAGPNQDTNLEVQSGSISITSVLGPMFKVQMQ
uniref:Uncharacterized protein n=1 Tax=Cannabis sativa TaxID=3483 RepID=A0A803QRL0_CANSA